MKQQRFVIISMARTGSNLLSTLLGSHPHIFVHGELFKKNRDIGPLLGNYDFAGMEQRLGRDLLAYRDENPLEFLDEVLKVDRPCVGFKLFINHSDLILDYVLSSPDYKVIVLERTNRLASFSSVAIALETKVTHSKGDPITRTIEFDANEFLRLRGYVDKCYQSLRDRTVGRPGTIWTHYDELHSPDLHRRLLEFLGLDPQVPLTSPLVKQNPASPLSRFTNPETVLGVLGDIGKLDWAVSG